MSRRTLAADGPYTPPAAVREIAIRSADGSRLHIETYGPQDAPAVVLVHGWTCSTGFWAPVIRELSADHRVIAYDQRGHGRSPAAGPGGYSTDALADDLRAVLDATLFPGERAVIAGHSMGAMTLLAAAGRSGLQDRAAAVALCSTGASRLIAEARVLPLRAAGLRTRLQGALLGSSAPLGPVTGLSKRILKYGTMGPAATAEQVAACARIVHACPRAVRAGWAKVLAGLDLGHGIARLTVPTAVVVGTADRLTPAVHARRLAKELPNCLGLTELDGAGHMTPVERPEAVTGLLRTLVRDHLAPAAPVAGSATIPVQHVQHKEETS